MQFTFRCLTIWGMLCTLVWTPVLARSIEVDTRVPVQQQPAVAVINSVPVVNIAPPSAGGVSNNRYTEFNVEPAGVVLNNSGEESQTRLAGKIAGNPILDSRPATIILNQVTTPNSSQLRGILEVAGAPPNTPVNVIVANPAGITCNGCDFLNAKRATLTTGQPVVGPDGRIGFHVAKGHLRIEGEGLRGVNVSQVDLLARSLKISGGIWTNRLNIVAGASHLDYDTGVVSAAAGDGAPPKVALNAATLGGMYANSIHLISNEAGVGMNIGNHLVTMTGDLKIDAAGDVHILPTATMQLADALTLKAADNLTIEGSVASNGTASLAAGRKAVITGQIHAGAVRLQAGQHLQGDLTMEGRVSSDGTIWLAAGRKATVTGQVHAAGTAYLYAGQNLVIGQSGQVRTQGRMLVAKAGDQLLVAGALRSQHDASLYAGRTLALQRGGKAKAKEALQLRAGTNLSMRPGSLAQGAWHLALAAGGDVKIDGKVITDGQLSLAAGQHVTVGHNGRLRAKRQLAVKAGGDIAMTGRMSAWQELTLNAGKEVSLTGGTVSSGGTLTLTAGASLNMMEDSLLRTAQHLAVQVSGPLTNMGGILAAGGNASFVLAGILHNIGGTISVLGNASIVARTARNWNARLFARDLTLQVERFDQTRDMVRVRTRRDISAGQYGAPPGLVGG